MSSLSLSTTCCICACVGGFETVRDNSAIVLTLPAVWFTTASFIFMFRSLATFVHVILETGELVAQFGGTDGRIVGGQRRVEWHSLVSLSPLCVLTDLFAGALAVIAC